jgi:outer membrane protein
LQNYDYLKANRDQIEAKTKKIEQEYRNRAQGLQNEITAYQRNVTNMTLGQVKAVEEDLGKKQQNLQLYQQSISQQLMEEQEKLNKELYDRITTYLKKYAAEKDLHFVLKFDVSSDVLYAGDALDVSEDVIRGLNADYQQEKTGTTAVKKDTTANKK